MHYPRLSKKYFSRGAKRSSTKSGCLPRLPITATWLICNYIYGQQREAADVSGTHLLVKSRGLTAGAASTWSLLPAPSATLRAEVSQPTLTSPDAAAPPTALAGRSPPPTPFGFNCDAASGCAALHRADCGRAATDVFFILPVTHKSGQAPFLFLSDK